MSGTDTGTVGFTCECIAESEHSEVENTDCSNRNQGYIGQQEQRLGQQEQQVKIRNTRNKDKNMRNKG